MAEITRRELIRLTSGACVALAVSPYVGCGETAATPTAVHVVLGDSVSQLYEMSREAARQLGITKNALLGETVLLKPNLVAIMGAEFAPMVSYDPTTGESTKAEIILGVAEQCLEAGAARVTIADGAQTLDWDWHSLGFFDGNIIHGTSDLGAGVEYLQSHHGDGRVELLRLSQHDRWVRIPSSSSDTYVAEGLPVAEPFCEADHVISLPVLKTHAYSQLSGAMKNLVGVIKAENVPNSSMWVRHRIHNAYEFASLAGFHNVGIAGAFLDIVAWRRSERKTDFAILDCSIGLDTLGPVRIDYYGKPARTVDFKEHSVIGQYFLLASSDLVALDATAARITNYPIDDVKQLAMARALGLGTLDNIVLKGAQLQDLAIPDWVAAVQDSEAFFRGPMFQ